ncbi:hypothetical protein [Egicoccus sp. AB-alg2]|uniref:hypothetical protein n=1 Tax=Egicoccus sp. AB-alg2 TaxID=3242693 RepID=UPI00359E7490
MGTHVEHPSIFGRLRVALTAGIAVALALIPLAVAAPASAQTASESGVAGVLPDGTRYGFIRPPDWNGTLLLDPDFMGFVGGSVPPTPTGANRWLLDAGYAIGGTSRLPTLDRVQSSVAALLSAADLFTEEFGAPRRTVVTGSSLGGFTARAAVEAAPERVDGTVAFCGGGAGVVAGWNQKLDAAFVAKTLLADGDDGLELVGIGNANAATAAWNALVEEAASTPEGRARLALAAAVGQMATFADPAMPQPEARDFDLQLEHQIATFQLFVRPSIRATIESVAGGNISWNHGVDYRQALARSGGRPLVDRVYRAAGLDLNADLDVLAEAPRVAADPDAVAWAEDNVAYTGDTGGRPVLTLHTAGDRSESTAFDDAYAQAFRAAGANALLRQAWVERAGHCSFTQAERLAAVLTLVERIETGRWAAAASPSGLNDLAARLDAGSPLDLGTAAFFRPAPQQFLRPWDGRHIGGYVPWVN